MIVNYWFVYFVKLFLLWILGRNYASLHIEISVFMGVSDTGWRVKRAGVYPSLKINLQHSLLYQADVFIFVGISNNRVEVLIGTS